MRRLMAGVLGLAAATWLTCVQADVSVLAVRLGYLPEALLWLVTSPHQVRIMRAHQPDVPILTLAEAQDLLTAIGDPRPSSLMEVARSFATAPPGAPEWPEEDDDEKWV